jgi:hypothetical protein
MGKQEEEKSTSQSLLSPWGMNASKASNCISTALLQSIPKTIT